jgi:hypothetical protein
MHRFKEEVEEKLSTLNSLLKFCISTKTKVSFMKIRKKCIVVFFHCKLSALEFNEKVQLKGR